jgi:6-phosphogluconolactonase (cycloisomerase 2 family)
MRAASARLPQVTGRLLVASWVLAAGLALVLADNATAGGDESGAVYVQSNSAPLNYVHVLNRAADGRITNGGAFATGGSGRSATPPFGFPITDSQGAVALSKHGRLVFATNAGSNTVSSFRVTDGGLALVDQEPSRGQTPTSVAVAERGIGHQLLYVMNVNPVFPCLPFPVGCGSGGGTLSGYIVDSGGDMTPIPGAVRTISGGVLAGQVGFNSDDSVLTVPNRGSNSISTFTVRPDGSLGPERVTPSTGTGVPFGFAYTKNDRLVMSNFGATAESIGSASSYALDRKTAGLTPVDTKLASGIATCWVALTADDRYAFMTNSLSADISRFAVSRSGALTLLGVTPAGGVALDEDTDDSSRYLYVLVADVSFATGLPVFGQFAVTGYRIGADGSLTAINTVGGLPVGSSGAAAS